MQALRFYEKNTFKIDTLPVPDPGGGEVLVKVKAAAICGTDVRMLQNGGSFSPERPLIPGHEFAGIIEKSNAPGFTEGARVAIAPNIGCGICTMCIKGDSHHCASLGALGVNMDGGFAQYVVIPKEAVRQGNVQPLADSLSFAEGAINEALSCALNGFKRLSFQSGETYLVIGAGAIGLMHAKLARMAGASKVFIHDLSKDRLDFAQKLDAFFTPIYGDLEQEIMEGTGGLGCDAIVTACPVPAVQQLSLKLAAVNGRINFFGGLPKDRENVALNSNIIHYHQLFVTGSTRASLSQYAEALRFISSGILSVRELVSDTYSLSEAEKAFDNAAHTRGLKHVILFD